MSAKSAAGGVGLALLIATIARSLETHAIPEETFASVLAMTTLFYGQYPFRVRTRDFWVTEAEDTAKRVRGKDKSGRQWQVLLPAATHGLWKSAVNSDRTYYFEGYTGGAGMAPDTWILALSFDDQGRRVPFYVRTYAGYDSKGVADAVDLDGTGPELLQQDWVETSWTTDSRSGYHVISLSRQRGVYGIALTAAGLENLSAI